MAENRTLTVERLSEALDYDPLTGVFRWKVHRPHGPRIGDIAGCATEGYWCIRIDDKLYLAHRLAWLYVNGVWPHGELDHENENPSDNRIANLREATHQQNQHNIRGPRKNGTSGYRGVSRARHRWRAQITVDGKNRNLGHFDTPEEASVAYLAAKRELHPFCSTGGS